MPDTIRPQVTIGDTDLNQRVELFAEENGLNKKDAWAQLVRQGLDCPSGAEVTIVVNERMQPVAVFADTDEAEGFAARAAAESAGHAGIVTLTVDSPNNVEWIENEP